MRGACAPIIFDARVHPHPRRRRSRVRSWSGAKLSSSYCAAVGTMNLTKLRPAELERDANELD